MTSAGRGDAGRKTRSCQWLPLADWKATGGLDEPHHRRHVVDLLQRVEVGLGEQIEPPGVRVTHRIALGGGVELVEEVGRRREDLEGIDQPAVAAEGQVADVAGELEVDHVVRVEVGLRRTGDDRGVDGLDALGRRLAGHLGEVERRRLGRDAVTDVVGPLHQQQHVEGGAQEPVDTAQALGGPLAAETFVDHPRVDAGGGEQPLQAPRIAAGLPALRTAAVAVLVESPGRGDAVTESQVTHVHRGRGVGREHRGERQDHAAASDRESLQGHRHLGIGSGGAPYAGAAIISRHGTISTGSRRTLPPFLDENQATSSYTKSSASTYSRV